MKSIKTKWVNNGLKCRDGKDYLQKLRNKFGFDTWRKNVVSGKYSCMCLQVKLCVKVWI